MSAPGGKAARPAAAEPARPAAAGKEVPKVLVDPRTRRSFVRGRFLGKGGFARCYELAEAESREVFAGKVVPKSLLVKPHQKEKMSMEIAIHRSLSHRHVVGFQSFFEDDDFVYVVLELCRRRDTYIRIKKNEYTIPKHINPVAASLIQKMLRSDPATRPTINELLNDEFFTSGYLPGRLPTSCLTIAPRFSLAPSSMELGGRRPLTALNKGLDSPAQEPLPDKEEAAGLREVGDAVSCHLADMLQQLTAVNAAKPSERVAVRQEEAEDPACIPIFWVSKWVDYSDKYGLGYQLCDNSVGVLFNDSTRLIMYNDGDNLQYIEQNNTESYFTVRSYPSALNKKITLLKYFRNYMSEHLLKAGANITPREGDELARLPYLCTWFRTRSAIILHLSNGTVQINFFQDHTKVILCPLMAAVTYIDEKRDFRTYKLSLIEEHGCCRELASRLRYARTMVEKLLSSKSGSGRMKSST
ncbi:Serine/threonine-protein kinase PLK1 [Lonchura striata]|uniref:Serine/threonine-protein kinase PLK n=1 Tax=Lonchura striata TaxID=40157 RepID=A0A218UAG4_9PASE|nr:Serine/threonine-protein kinase PLK1 [Lonchura striata domestica]